MAQVTVYVRRKFTLRRGELPPVQFQPGANTVDADVAAHPFVKGLTVGSAEAPGSAELDAMRARAEAAEAQVVELQAVIEATAAMGKKK